MARPRRPGEGGVLVPAGGIHVPHDPGTKRAWAYREALAGRTWAEIAVIVGFATLEGAHYYAAVYAARRGLPWPLKIRAGRRIGPDDHPEIARLRAEGATLREIGERYGVSAQRIHQILSTQESR